MLPLTLVSHGISGEEASPVAFFLMIAFAIIWQIATVIYNRQRVVSWLMLIVYLVLFILPIMGSVV